jgi:hypothetical protein
MSQSNPLWEDILIFSKKKKRMAVGLILLGCLGLVLPVIPGIALIALGILYLKPEWYDKLKQIFGKG